MKSTTTTTMPTFLLTLFFFFFFAAAAAILAAATSPSLITRALVARQDCFDCGTRLAACKNGCGHTAECNRSCTCLIAATSYCEPQCGIVCPS
ncbi:hypothetical protein EJ02DRAFT_435980 [Clathrospora elynae]|uniref:Uncharacterized protein n=1 Tax=Clathrospora elynae TaxID=706981 RepID=A0A6A5SGX7_9PLEO|nr:hypothetical protein EJ02DRAFT_435980 [Clathrospora elynae]